MKAAHTVDILWTYCGLEHTKPGQDVATWLQELYELLTTAQQKSSTMQSEQSSSGNLCLQVKMHAWVNLSPVLTRKVTGRVAGGLVEGVAGGVAGGLKGVC